MESQSRRAVSVVLGPTATATTCRVSRARASQIQVSLAFLKTNVHSSSSSKSIASGSSGSGGSSIWLRGGCSATFFYPATDGLAVDPKRPLQPTQARALVVGAQNLFAALGRVAVMGGVLAALSPAGVAAILLLPIWRQPVFHEFLTSTMPAGQRDRNRHLSTLSLDCLLAPSYQTIPVPSTTIYCEYLVQKSSKAHTFHRTEAMR